MLTIPLILTLATSWTYLSLFFSLLFCYLCLLESVGLEQHVNQPTHKRGHALDLIITRKVNEIIRSPPYVSDHGSVVCSILAKVTATRVRTELTYRKLRSVKLDSLKNSLTSSGLCSVNCVELLVPRDPEVLVNQYNSTLSSVIDQHAPLKTKTVKTTPQVPWYSEEIALAKRRRQKAEKKPADLLLFNKMKYNATFIMNRARKEFYADFINENGTDQGRLFRATEKLLAPIDDLCFSEYNDNSLLDNDIGRFFFLKTDKIRKDVDATDIEPNELNRLLPVDSAVENKLLRFHRLSQEDVFQLVQRSAKKMCPLDPMPTSMVVNCQDKLLGADLGGGCRGCAPPPPLR